MSVLLKINYNSIVNITNAASHKCVFKMPENLSFNSKIIFCGLFNVFFLLGSFSFLILQCHLSEYRTVLVIHDQI